MNTTKAEDSLATEPVAASARTGGLSTPEDSEDCSLENSIRTLGQIIQEKKRRSQRRVYARLANGNTSTPPLLVRPQCTAAAAMVVVTAETVVRVAVAMKAAMGPTGGGSASDGLRNANSQRNNTNCDCLMNMYIRVIYHRRANLILTIHIQTLEIRRIQQNT